MVLSPISFVACASVQSQTTRYSFKTTPVVPSRCTSSNFSGQPRRRAWWYASHLMTNICAWVEDHLIRLNHPDHNLRPLDAK